MILVFLPKVLNLKPDLVPIWVTSDMNKVTKRTSGVGNMSIFKFERSLLSLADGSQISNCSLPCTTHQIYAWLTHRSKRRGSSATATIASKADGGRVEEEGRIDGDGMEKTKGSLKKDKKRGQQEIDTASKDDIRMEGDRPIDGDQMEDAEESLLKNDTKRRQEIILIFSQQVT